MANIRDFALRIAWKLYGVPYRWGGDDPMAGFDCSGMIVEVLKSVGVLHPNSDYTAGQLFDLMHPVGVRPQAGDLVFYENKNGKIVHAEMIYNIDLKLSIGASGGGSSTVSVEDAIAQNAFIKIRPYERGRKIAGFRDPFRGLK